MNKFIRLIGASFICLIGLIGQPTARAEAKAPLTLMVVPQFPAVQINAAWGPLLKTVETKLGRPINLIYAADIPAFEEAFIAGKPDIIYCNPYHAVMAFKAQKYEPIIRREKPLKGILIAPEGTSGLSALNGQTLLFPAPNAFGASLYMRALLVKEHKLTFNTVYVKTHPNVIRGVVRGQGAAGGMVGATFNAEPDNLKQKVSVIYETPPAPAHPISVHPRVSEEERNALQTLILEALTADPKAAAEIQMKNPIKTSYESEYTALDKLGLEEFLK